MVVSYGIFKDVGNALKHSLWSSHTQTIPIRKFTFQFFLFYFFFCSFTFLFLGVFALNACFAVQTPFRPYACMQTHKKRNFKLKINKRSNDRTTEIRNEWKRMNGVQRHAWHKGYNLSVNIILWNVASILIERPRMTLFHTAQRTTVPSLFDYILHIAHCT